MSVIAACPSCGQKNRIPAAHLADTGRCGTCKAALPPLAAPFEAGVADFDAVVTGAKVPVLVDFWAAWCGPCKMVAPEVAALAGEMAGRALILKVDIEAHPALAARYRVQSIPNFILFRDGQPVMQRPGAASRQEMRRWIEAD